MEGKEERGGEREGGRSWENKAERERRRAKEAWREAQGEWGMQPPQVPSIQRLCTFALVAPQAAHARLTQPACRSEATEGHLLTRQKR